MYMYTYSPPRGARGAVYFTPCLYFLLFAVLLPYIFKVFIIATKI